MATIGIHKSQIVHPQMWIVLAKLCNRIELLGWQGDEIVVYRITGDELPDDDKMIQIVVECLPGIEPYCSKIEVSDHIWQQLKH